MKINEIKKNLQLILKICMLMVIAFTFCSIKANAETNNWTDWQKRDYWEWHTRTTTDDQAYNGEHIAIEGDKINFYGYGVVSYKDFLYRKYKNNGRKVFYFRIDETEANYHTLDGAGIIFNSSIKNNKLTGYIVLFRETEIAIYRLENVDVKTFEETDNKIVEDYGTLIKKESKVNTKVHDLVVEITPTNINIKDNNTKVINQNLEYSKHTGNSFGLISSYVNHNCNKLSKIQFSQFNMIINDYNYEVLNTDMNNTPITGGKFIVKDEDGNTITEGKTNANGVYEINESLTPGKYTIKQTQAPDGYEINNEEYTFIISSDGRILDANTNTETKIIIKNNKKSEQTTETTGNNKKDTTTANKSIPNAGMKTIIAFLAVVTLIVVVFFIRYTRYKSIK